MSSAAVRGGWSRTRPPTGAGEEIPGIHVSSCGVMSNRDMILEPRP